MRLQSVHIESLGHALPEERVTSDALEERIAPVYGALGLHVGRLELMSGIRERRFWPPGTRPSRVAALAGEEALGRSGIDRGRIGCLVHASVCRDFLEPATASVVHAYLELPPTCLAFDLSNACLGFANSLLLVGGMIERGEIEAGLIVAGEDGRPLVEETLRVLSAAGAVSRDELKAAYASLTIGSGAVACVLTHESLSRTPHRLLGGTALAATQHHELCSGDHVAGSADSQGPLMRTDAEALLREGNALAARTWERFCAEFDWTPDGVDRIVTHQVGAAHRRLLFETLELDLERDFPTLATLGNIGSVSLPLSLSLAVDEGFVTEGQRVALLGIGSGLHCLMLAVHW
ncbi:MAG: 3-oxoacyl-ACP synthase III [Planctomycetota bacterium]